MNWTRPASENVFAHFQQLGVCSLNIVYVTNHGHRPLAKWNHCAAMRCRQDFGALQPDRHVVKDKMAMLYVALLSNIWYSVTAMPWQVGVTAAARIRKTCLCLVDSSVAVDQWRHQFLMWTSLSESQITRVTSHQNEPFVVRSPMPSVAANIISSQQSK